MTSKMSEFQDLMKLLREQHREEMEEQRKQHKAELEVLKSAVSHGTTTTFAIPSFTPFDSTSELWEDYWSRFSTFATANSVPEERKANIFLTNQSPTLYKQITNLAAQTTPPKKINELTMQEIIKFMKEQYDPKRFLIRERFKFWSDMRRKPGETLQELASRIRDDAATCDFASIKDAQDEALRQRFICSVNNEAVLKSLFRIKEDELTFPKAVQVAVETEEAAKVAKETIHGTPSDTLHNVMENPRKKPICYRCGNEH